MCPTFKPEQLKAVIFDLDGTIFDSRHANIVFYNYLLAHVGLPTNAHESVEVLHKESMDTSLRYLMGEGELYRKAMEHWKTMDPAMFVGELKLFPFVAESLEKLSRKYMLAVSTNRTKTTKESLERFNLWEYFSQVVTPLDATKAKPDPRMISLILDKQNLNKDQVIFVGDSSLDEELCQNVGVRFIAFNNTKLDAWAHIDDYRKLCQLLDA